MRGHTLIITLSSVFIFISFLISEQALASWETGAQAGYDSNIDRAIEGGDGDSYITGFLSFFKESDEDSAPVWTLNLSLEGTGYAESGDLNYGIATLSPSIIFYPHPKWSLGISPFIQAIGVSDEEQSAVALGGQGTLKQLWNGRYYTGEYIVYVDSRADVDVYSYKEKAAGIFAGVNWTDVFWTELGYEFSREDSFRAVEEVVASSTNSGRSGRGRSRRYSQAYDSYIISEPVDRTTMGVNLGYRFTRHLSSFINYAFVTYSGDSGDSESHTVSVGISYGF